MAKLTIGLRSWLFSKTQPKTSLLRTFSEISQTNISLTMVIFRLVLRALSLPVTKVEIHQESAYPVCPLLDFHSIRSYNVLKGNQTPSPSPHNDHETPFIRCSSSHFRFTDARYGNGSRNARTSQSRFRRRHSNCWNRTPRQPYLLRH